MCSEHVALLQFSIYESILFNSWGHFNKIDDLCNYIYNCIVNIVQILNLLHLSCFTIFVFKVIAIIYDILLFNKIYLFVLHKKIQLQQH